MTNSNDTRTFSVNVTVNSSNYAEIVKAMSGPPPYGVKNAPPPEPTNGESPSDQIPESADAQPLMALVSKTTTITLPYVDTSQGLFARDATDLKILHDAHTLAQAVLFLWLGRFNIAVQGATVREDTCAE